MPVEWSAFWIHVKNRWYAGVVSSLTLDEVTQRVNEADALPHAREYTGTPITWRLADEGFHLDGGPNPRPWPDAPDTHTFYVFTWL